MEELQYETELEALNAMCGKLDTLITRVGSTNSTLNSTNNALNQIGTKLDSSNNLQAAGNDLTTKTNELLNYANSILVELRGAVTDVRNLPEDVRIERIYIGDIANKRDIARDSVAKLLAEGYRPYIVAGISEDLARVVFVKFPAPNKAK